MSVYFDYLISEDKPSSSSDEDDSYLKTHVSWHQSYPVVAIASFSSTRGCNVKIYNDQGKSLGAKIRPTLPVDENEDSTEMWWSLVSTLAWHPTKRFLAIAWEKCDISIWNDHEGVVKKCEDQRHKDAVHVLKWSLLGSRLMSIDNYGSCVAWKVDEYANMSVIYHHDLKESIMQLTFKSINPSVHSQINKEIRSIAKAAINGNDKALDMFMPVRMSSANLKQKNNDKDVMPKFPDESFDCYIGSSTGSIYYFNGNGSCSEVGHNTTSVYKMLYYSEKDILLVVTTSLQLITYQSSYDGTIKEISKVKVMSKNPDPDICWCGSGLLAMSCGENFLRVFDINTNSSYTLNFSGTSQNQFKEVLSSIAYSDKGILAAGSNMGSVITWEYQNSQVHDSNDEENQWKIQTPNSLHGCVKQLSWGIDGKCLSVNTQQQVYLLHKHLLCTHFNHRVAGVQTSASVISIDDFVGKNHLNLITDIKIHGLYVTSKYIAAWSKSSYVVYEFDFDSEQIISIGNFKSSSPFAAIFEQTLFLADENKVLVTTFQGTRKQTLVCSEEEGPPTMFEICQNILVVGYAEGYIKSYDLSRREVKPHTNPKYVVEYVKSFRGFHSVKVNCSGNKISFVVHTKESSFEPDSKLYIWDLEGDSISYFDLKIGKSEDDINLSSNLDELSPAERLRHQVSKEVCQRLPVAHFWDPEEPRLLICNAARSEISDESSVSKNLDRRFSTSKQKAPIVPSSIVISFFVTSENGIMIQDHFPLEENDSTIIGVHVPYYYISSKNKSDGDESSNENSNIPETEMSKLVKVKSMRDFVGLEMSDKLTKDSMMNFSFFLTIGNMDEAFKAIKSIKSENVWENMAKMCVKTKRLDVASVCLGKMGHAYGAKALREAIATVPEEDARVAILAITLGMLEEAQELYLSCGRYDLLNKMYQDSNQWDRAIQIAESNDRINLRTTYYNYGKHLESIGNTRAAISFFESSDTHMFEVPRMLLDDPESLDEYIQKSRNKNLWKWWAQYMESTGEMETALRYYEAANDHLALVRVYCYLNNLDKAADIANDSGDKLACFHLGRQHENNGNIKEAIHFFARAHAFSNAVRLCKENDLEDQLLNLALMSGADGMVDAARYYETKEGFEDKAVMLYHKAGYLNKAVELAFRVKQFSTLQHIANDLDDKADPELLKRCAEFFIENGHFDRAVDLLSIAKKYQDALDLCIQHHVIMTEKLAEKLTPPKNDCDNIVRIKVLEQIAECAMNQENYRLATKKFTQAGNKMQAMKALLKSGDTEKIIFFAGVSRQKEIYVMAANYLQSLDWKKDPEVMKNIISFYTKGHALELLSSFYEACAQVEMDEYQNYEKALGALNESFKCLSKLDSKLPQFEQKISKLKIKMELVRKYVQATRLYDEDPEEAMKICKLLLQEEMLEIGVKSGDVYGLMVEHYAKIDNFQVAYALVEEMRVRISNVNLSYYINPNILQLIYSKMGLPLPVNQVIDSDEEIQSRPQTAVGYVEVYDSDDDSNAIIGGRKNSYDHDSLHLNQYA